MAGDASGWVAAGAAVAAAAVVAWQSWETRKSAESSRDAVRAANDGLDLSRQQVAEAVRTRIDASTPTVVVSVPDEPEWPPLEPSNYFGGEAQPLPVGPFAEPLHMPRDGRRQIAVRVPVTIRNDSDVIVRLEAGGLVDRANRPLASPFEVQPRETVTHTYGDTRSLDEWIEAHGARVGGDPAVRVGGFVRFSDPSDTGAIDHWDLGVTGTVVTPAEQLDGAWNLLPAPDHNSGRPGAIGVNPVFRHRTYWLSKTRNERLPD